MWGQAVKAKARVVGAAAASEADDVNSKTSHQLRTAKLSSNSRQQAPAAPARRAGRMETAGLHSAGSAER